jgi:hypothetical protein
MRNFQMTAATTTKTAKVANYTDEQTAGIKAAYIAGREAKQSNKENTEAIAKKFGKTARSIVAKLTKEGVYQKEAYVSKTGEPVLKKNDAADAIGKVLGLSVEDTDSLAKANKSALSAIFKALAESKPIDGTETAKVQAADADADADADANGYGNSDESREG